MRCWEDQILKPKPGVGSCSKWSERPKWACCSPQVWPPGQTRVSPISLAHCPDPVFTGSSAETPLHIITSGKRTNGSLNTFQEHGCIITLKLPVMWHLVNYKLLENGARANSSLNLGTQSSVWALEGVQWCQLCCSKEDKTQSWLQILFLAISNHATSRKTAG